MDNGWEFNDSSTMFAQWNVRKEGVVARFTVSGVPVAPGAYDSHEVAVNYTSNRSAPANVGMRVEKSGVFRRHIMDLRSLTWSPDGRELERDVELDA